jgi:phosphoribosylanthranilate isomerase
MIQIKICGVTRPDDAARTAAAGADYLGLNFWPRSKRYLEPPQAHAVAAAARGAGAIRIVGLFVDADIDAIRAVLARVELDVIQLHGDESPEVVRAVAAATQRPVWKAIAAGARADLESLTAWPVDALLLDTPSAGRGGSGKTFDWTLAAEARQRYPQQRFLVAGGLDPHNVAAAIAAVAPWGVDVASGVESAPGIKDPAKVADFVAAVRAHHE